MKLLAPIKNNRLFKNMGYLTILQMCKYLFPFLYYPYLLRVIGYNGYGILYLAQSVISYFVLLVNYGFYLSGPRLIAIHREDPQKVSEIFSTIMVIKASLAVFSFGVILVASLTVPLMRPYAPAYIVTTLALVSEVIFPQWFFQGMENMHYITILNVASSFVAMLLLFLFVHHASDLYIACAINSSSGVIAGVLSFVIVVRRYKVRFKPPGLKLFRTYLVDNWNLFLAQFPTSVFQYANGVLLGFFIKDKTITGYYGTADKVVRMVVSLIQPVTMAVYPAASRLFHRSLDNALVFLKKVLRYGTIAFLGVSVLLFAFAGVVTFILGGANQPTVTLLIRILSIIPTTIFINNIYGTQIMVNCGMEIQFRNIILFCSVFLIGTSVVLINLFSVVGAGVSSLMSEVLIAGLMVWQIERNKRLRLFGKRVNFDEPA